MWKSVCDGVPKHRTKVLAFYKNKEGNGTIITAWYIHKKRQLCCCDYDCDCECDEETEEVYVPEGWYEHIDNWEDFCFCPVYEGWVTHWMPLPRFPSQ
jgi:hypothetical protein